MKRLALVLFMGICPFFLMAQNSDGDYNPYVNSGVISPAPLFPHQAGGTGVFSFNFGNSGSDPLVVNGEEFIILTISLSKGEPDIDPGTAIGGTSANLFNWTYNSGSFTYTGEQISTIPAQSTGTISIAIKVTENTDYPGNNGFNVNIAPAPYQNTSNTESDDAVSSYTYTEIRDFGDAPSSYGSANHLLDFTHYLGTVWDGERNDLASDLADGDDNDGVDDEDGVLIPSPIFRGELVDIPVTVTGEGFLSAWIDWNGDGDFEDGNERIENNSYVDEILTNRTVTVPGDAIIDSPTFARFRFSTSVISSSSDTSASGEVEDYQLTIQCNPPDPTLSCSNTTFCPGTSVVFTAGGGDSYIFRVDGDTVQNGSSATYTSNSLADGEFVDVIVTDGNGCSAISTGITCIVHPVIVPTLTSSDLDDEFCAGISVTFSTATEGVLYDFRLNGLNVYTGPANSFETSSLIDGATMEVIVTDGNGCLDTSNLVTNTVLALPDPILTSTDTSFCAGTTIVFSATGGTDYLFRIDGVEVQNSSLSSYNSDFMTDGQVVDVIVTDGNGCVATSSLITTDVLPLPDPTLESSDTTFCAGTTIVFSATGGTDYLFRLDGTQDQTGSSSTYTNSFLADGQTVDVIVTDGNGCSDTSDVITTIVYPLPVPTLSSTYTTFCAGTSIVLTATGGETYDFRVDGLSAQNGTLATYTTDSLTDNQIVDVLVSSSEGCSGTSGGIQFSVEENPTADAGLSPGDICQGGTTLELDGSVGGSATTGFWSTTSGGSFLPDAGTLNATWTPPSDFNDSATLILTTTSGGNCGEATSFITQVVHPLPGPPEVSTATIENVCPSVTVDLTALITSTMPVDGLILYKTTNDPEGDDVSLPEAVDEEGIYYLFYKSYEGCFSPGTAVTFTINDCPPDVTPTLIASSSIMNGVTSFDLIVRITELNGMSTTEAITVNIPIDTRLTLDDGFVETLTELGGTDLNNNYWTYSSNTINHVFTTSTPIPANGSSYFGFVVTFDPGQTRGVYSITSQLVSGGGGESRINNNADSESLNYFQK